jgi:hypothetical protein
VSLIFVSKSNLLFYFNVFKHFLDALMPYVINAIRNHQEHENIELTVRALNFCLQRVEVDQCCDLMSEVKANLLLMEGLDMDRIDLLLALSLVWMLFCKVSGQNAQDFKYFNKVTGPMSYLADKVNAKEIDVSLYIERLLLLFAWSEPNCCSPTSDCDTKSILDEVIVILNLPTEVALESMVNYKGHEESRRKEKQEYLPLASEMMREIWHNYVLFKGCKVGISKKVATELLAQTILTLTGGAQPDENVIWIKEDTDRSCWVKVLLEMLNEELSVGSEDESAILAITSSFSLEAWKRTSDCWNIFSKLIKEPEKKRLREDNMQLQSAMCRLYMTMALLGCNPNENVKIDEENDKILSFLSLQLQSLRRLDNSRQRPMVELTLVTDFMTFLCQLTSPRDATQDVKHFNIPKETAMQWIDTALEFEDWNQIKSNIKFRLLCFKIVKNLTKPFSHLDHNMHNSGNNDQLGESFRQRIAGRLFGRLHDVEWYETIDELMIPQSHTFPTIGKKFNSI